LIEQQRCLHPNPIIIKSKIKLVFRGKNFTVAAVII